MEDQYSYNTFTYSCHGAFVPDLVVNYKFQGEWVYHILKTYWHTKTPKTLQDDDGVRTVESTSIIFYNQNTFVVI